MTTPRDSRAQYSDDPIVGAVRAYLEEGNAPDLEPAVMQEVRALPRHGRRSSALRAAWSWLVAPHRVTLPIRPAYGLAGAMAAILLFVFVGTGDPDPAGVSMAEERPAPVVLVQFRFEAPGASAVQLAGTFSEWEPRHSLVEMAPGVWTVTVPVQPGVHEYAFVVDGQEWRVDPFAPQVEDSFGGVNNRLPVVTTTTAAS